jgi:hypothetical protein
MRRTAAARHDIPHHPERSEVAYFADEELAQLPLPSTARGATQEHLGRVPPS